VTESLGEFKGQCSGFKVGESGSAGCGDRRSEVGLGAKRGLDAYKSEKFEKKPVHRTISVKNLRSQYSWASLKIRQQL
jgi:hypothetical protein